MNLEKCPRSKLQQQCIKYLGPVSLLVNTFLRSPLFYKVSAFTDKHLPLQMERDAYEVVIEGGKLLYKESRELLQTTKDAKWIFVLSTSKTLYVGKKKKGTFQHSSFLAGGATTAAGRLVVDGGVLKV